VRGEWLLLVEPGARLQQGWIDEVLEYIALNRRPARFSLARHYRRPLLRRIVTRTPPLEMGLLLTKREALEAVRSGSDLAMLVTGLKAVTLSSELIPARAMRAAG
jgi:hypothetical protein